jgi:hypothetical protein
MKLRLVDDSDQVALLNNPLRLTVTLDAVLRLAIE